MYDQTIKEEVARQGFIGLDPRHVEAWMRLEHSTLDGLSKAQFSKEVGTCIVCIQEAGYLASEELAKSFGM